MFQIKPLNPEESVNVLSLQNKGTSIDLITENSSVQDRKMVNYVQMCVGTIEVERAGKSLEARRLADKRRLGFRVWGLGGLTADPGWAGVRPGCIGVIPGCMGVRAPKCIGVRLPSR